MFGSSSKWFRFEVERAEPDTAESILWLEIAITHERKLAAEASLGGWPSEANYYRRQARKAMRILARVKGEQK